MNLVGKFLLYFLSFGVAGYAVFTYTILPLGAVVSPAMKLNFIAHSSVIYTHVFASLLALLIGPFQFNTRFRSKYKNAHRWMGRLYLAVGVLLGGLSGLYLSQLAAGGSVARTGFGILAILWLYSGFRAYLSIRRGAISDHKKWMIRNFSLTFAAVTLRLYLPLSMASGVEFTLAYAIIAWLCWVPNLIFAEWRFVN
ncbi:MAG: DUF2306 domain-containing protein [Gammaproteobacteria bacterium]